MLQHSRMVREVAGLWSVVLKHNVRLRHDLRLRQLVWSRFVLPS
jgi:hypothetical protein